jgi:2-methylisocitrate lyase-like PEP mutase family enzyme
MTDSVARFRALHQPGTPLLMPNAWDVGSARVLQSLGFTALATTSSGAAAAAGLPDGRLGRDAALEQAAMLARAVEIPVSADLENGFADDPDGVAATFRAAADTALAGASVEDWSATEIYPAPLAIERVRAAVQAAAGRLLVTARAENHIRGIDDLDDTIARLRAFADAGADVVFAPGLREASDIRSVVDAVDVPLSVLVLDGVPPVSELGRLGVARVSVGGAFAFGAYATLESAAGELRAGGDGYLAAARAGGELVRRAL